MGKASGSRQRGDGGVLLPGLRLKSICAVLFAANLLHSSTAGRSSYCHELHSLSARGAAECLLARGFAVAIVAHAVGTPTDTVVAAVTISTSSTASITVAKLRTHGTLAVAATYATTLTTAIATAATLASTVTAYTTAFIATASLSAAAPSITIDTTHGASAHSIVTHSIVTHAAADTAAHSAARTSAFTPAATSHLEICTPRLRGARQRAQPALLRGRPHHQPRRRRSARPPV